MAFVVFAGQSNTGGAYMNASTLPAEWRPDPLTLIWDRQAKAWVEMKPGVNTGYGPMPDAWGPEVAFAMAFRQQHPNEVLRIVKFAEGGTALEMDTRQWVADWSPASEGELFDATLSIIREAGAAAGGIRPDAVFFGQGEEDANHAGAAADYDENLPAFFAAVREEWMVDPAGKIGFYRITGTPPYLADVRHAQAITDEADANALSVDARPFPLLGDGVHFSAQAHVMAGQAYFQMFQGWRTGAPPPGGDQGRVITSSGPGDALVGGAGNDTLNASNGPDVLTGGGGADVFAWAGEPWSPARVTDFAVGTDRLDLSRLFQATGYAGSDPIADGRVVLTGQEDDTLVLFDNDGPGGEWPNFIIRLEGVSAAGLTWSQLSRGGGSPPPPDDPPPPPPPTGEGQVINSPGPGSTLTGGNGNDTLNASQGADVLTGGGGADVFAWALEPWSPATVMDFTVGTDKLNLSALFQAAGYAGSDPIADGRIVLMGQDGDTLVLFDDDGAGGDWPNYIIRLEGVSASGLTWAQLAGGGSPPPPGDPPRFHIQGINARQAEGNDGTTAFTFLVQRIGDTSGTSQVDYAVRPGFSAGSPPMPTDAQDFAGATTGTLTFQPGQTEQVITISVRGDTTVEPEEVFVVQLSNARGAVIIDQDRPGWDGDTPGWILNDDGSTSNPGQVINSPGPGSTLTGGAGDDTLNASQGSDVLRGNGGADRFVFANENWSPARIVDFVAGSDRIDVSGVFDDWGYAGTDPIADGRLVLISDGSDGTKVLLDDDGPGGDWPNYVLHVVGVSPQTLSAGSHWIFQ